MPFRFPSWWEEACPAVGKWSFGEYHKARGDQTKDIFTRLYIPVVKGRVGVNVSWVFQEWYEMSPEVRDERYAVELKSPIVCRGDVIFNFISKLSGARSGWISW